MNIEKQEGGLLGEKDILLARFESGYVSVGRKD